MSLGTIIIIYTVWEYYIWLRRPLQIIYVQIPVRYSIIIHGILRLFNQIQLTTITPTGIHQPFTSPHPTHEFNSSPPKQTSKTSHHKPHDELGRWVSESHPSLMHAKAPEVGDRCILLYQNGKCSLYNWNSRNQISLKWSIVRFIKNYRRFRHYNCIVQ